MPHDPRERYARAGVDVAAGEALVERIKPLAAGTARAGATASLGGFGAPFDLAAAGHEGSLLVASTDGVGTKVRLATELGRHRGIGIDLVAMCVNDVLAQGAEPLFFLDYFASAKLDVAVAAEVVEGIAEGCRQAGCALIGGETAEMPGHYAPGDYDLAGFAVGAVPRERLLPRISIEDGDALIGLASSGTHANGYSLLRRIADDRRWSFSAPFGSGTLGEALLAPTRIYVRPTLAVLDAHGTDIKGIAHITGGGITGNVPRMLPDGLAASIERGRLPQDALRDFVKAEGGLGDTTMEATFNCGVGLVLACARDTAPEVIATFEGLGEGAYLIGSVAPHRAGEPRCLIV